MFSRKFDPNFSIISFFFLFFIRNLSLIPSNIVSCFFYLLSMILFYYCVLGKIELVKIAKLLLRTFLTKHSTPSSLLYLSFNYFNCSLKAKLPVLFSSHFSIYLFRQYRALVLLYKAIK